jgi:hypothetical protein
MQMLRFAPWQEVRFGSTAVLMVPKRDFRSGPKNGHRQTGTVGPVRANNGSRRASLDHLVGAAEER